MAVGLNRLQEICFFDGVCAESSAGKSAYLMAYVLNLLQEICLFDGLCAESSAGNLLI